MDKYSDIDAGNGEIITVTGDDSTDGQAFYRDGERIIRVDEDALDVFVERTGTSLADIDDARSVLSQGNYNPVAGFSFVTDAVFSQVDAKDLPVGGFPEAEELAQAYLENFYLAGAEQVERIRHGIDTGQVVAAEVMDAYLDTDGNAAADVDSIATGFDADGETVSESDLADLEAQNETGGQSEDADSGSDDTRLL